MIPAGGWPKPGQPAGGRVISRWSAKAARMSWLLRTTASFYRTDTRNYTLNNWRSTAGKAFCHRNLRQNAYPLGI